MRVALATCTTLPEPDPDAEPLLDALAAAGVDAEMVAWDRPGSTVAGFDACVFRSTWNYHLHLDRFLEWVDRAATVTRLHNPAGIVRWNHHKRYLHELDAAGVPIVPTRFVPSGHRASLHQLVAEHGWTDVVVKPAVSASSFRTQRFGAGEHGAGQQFLATLGEDRDAMVQPYLPSVETHGERALIRIDGEWTHAVRKQPRFAGADESVPAPIEPASDEIDLGERALAAIGGDLLYARVDVMRDALDAPVVSELELIEPSLYLAQHAPAAIRLANAIAAL